jgi:lipid II:glycine glycyltransferase (peptidoglycan interpeptide bridge formation enzyme)
MTTEWRGPFRDHHVFFPTNAQLRALAAACRPYEVFRSPHVVGTIDPVRTRIVSPSVTSCIDLTLPVDTLLRNMSAKSCRYEIRRAEKLADRLEFRTGGTAVEADYLDLYNKFVEWKGYTKPISTRRYQRYLQIGEVTVAYLDGVAVAGHLLIADKDASRVRLIFSASARFEEGELPERVGPLNRWLHWREMLHYREAGFATYDFGGGSPTSSIGRFKLSFGGAMEEGHFVVVEGALVRGPVRSIEALQRLARRRRAKAKADTVSATPPTSL